MRQFAKEIFFPKQCFFCQRYGALLCADCLALLEIFSFHRPDYSKKYMADIYSPCAYENKFVAKIIHTAKYRPYCKEMAAPLAEIIAGHFALAAPNFDFRDFILIPVPLAKKRIRQRGYNQSEIIAQKLNHIWQIPLISDCLIKIRETQNQADLAQIQREQNLKNAFACQNKNAVKNKNILLVDDVITTGATIEECAKALKKSGAGKIIGISVARTQN